MIKKEKVFELKIEDDDELSGIDSISLVDEPAIEVMWVAFSKEKEHEFHIPDNEDDIYLERLLSKGQPEQELLDEGWEIERIETVKENFATSPNAVSSEDNMFYRVRYKYALNSNIRQSPIIATTRQFCKQLINKNYVWRIEEIESEVNSFGQSAQFWRGGFNCRHQWYRIFYKRRGDITNKASASKSKIEVAGFPVELSPEWLQPDTVTSKTAANPSPSTVRNLGLKKQGFEVGVPHYTKDGKLYEGPMHKDASGRLMTGAVHTADSEYLYHLDELVKCKKCGHSWDMQDGGAKPYMCNKCGYDNTIEYKMGYDVGGLPSYVDEVSGDTISKPLVEPSMFESYNDYPESAKNNACKVLRWRDEHGDEVQGMTQVGWTRANQLCKGENISEETIARMASFARHRENAEVAPEFKDTPWKDKGYVAWLGWGGTSGVEWASSKLDSIRNNMSKQYFQISSDEQFKKIVLGPAMIPDQKIFRKDELGNPYYVFFSAETIKMIAEKYMRNKLIDNNDQMHDGKAIKDIHVLESWIKESHNDKSTDYGYGELPVGTWFVSMKVNNDAIWEKVKSKKLNGFSVSGFFSEEAAFSKEEMFLYQVAEILKKY
jgi:hypothetical protein